MKCEVCGGEFKNVAVHKRHKHPEVITAPEPLPAVVVPAAPANNGSTPPQGKLNLFLARAKIELNDKYEKIVIVGQLLVLSLAFAALMAGFFILHTQQTPLSELPFFGLAVVLLVIIFIMRKDLGFNIAFHVLKLMKKNPRIIYHVDGSKAVSRLVVGYDPKKGIIVLGRGAKATEIDITPDAVLYDADRNVPGGVHVGAERALLNLFKSAGDYWTAKQVDIMLKDAEQLGELRSNERINKMLNILYIVAGAAVISVLVGVITWTSVGQLNTSISILSSQLQGIPELVKNTLLSGKL